MNNHEKNHEKPGSVDIMNHNLWFIMISYLRDGNVKLSKLFEYAKIKDLVLEYSRNNILLVHVQLKWFWFILLGPAMTIPVSEIGIECPKLVFFT